jgi:hypothetical protein
MYIGREEGKFKLIFMSFSILKNGTSSSADGLHINFCSDLLTDSSSNPHSHPLIGGLLGLGPSFMLPFKNNLCSNRRSICFEGLKIVTQMVDFVSCLCRLVCLDTDNSSLFRGVIALVTRGSSHLTNRRKYITC